MNRPLSALPFPIPVVTTGPGSQPEAEDWSYLPLPSTIDTWRAPDTPEPGTPGAGEVLALLRGMVAAFDDDPARARVFPVHALSADAHQLLAQVMGEGEVSAQVALTLAWPDGARGAKAWAGNAQAEKAWADEASADDAQAHDDAAQSPPSALARIQESRYPGVWRVIVDSVSGARLGDWLEIGALPGVILDQAQRSGAVRGVIPEVHERATKYAPRHEDEGRETSANPADATAGLMNAPAIASEIAAAQATAIAQHGAGTHVVNFSLLPVTPADIAWLEAMLGTGTVALFSTGYGKCTVTATGWRHVWRVRYFDGANRALLDTLDITRIPEVVLASPDDLADSASHLREIVQWLERD